jgi:hypothetical protein
MTVLIFVDTSKYPQCEWWMNAQFTGHYSSQA